MTTTTATKGGRWRGQAQGTAHWLGLAASPTFALVGWIATGDAPAIALCSSPAGILPIHGMAWMYLLMSLFHLSPWLKLASGQRRQRN